MRQQNGNEYSISSIKTAVSAIYHYLNQNSVVSNLYDNKILNNFGGLLFRKIRYLTYLGYGEKMVLMDYLTKKSKVQKVLNHILIVRTTPRSLLKSFFIKQYY